MWKWSVPISLIQKGSVFVSEPMPAMTPICALGGDAPRVDTHGPITLSENPDMALASFAARLGFEDKAARSLARYIEEEAPAPSKAHQGKIGAFWVGPDQWMVFAPHDTHEDLAAQLVKISDGFASITEQNDAWCRFDLVGDGLADVFERLCPVNIRASVPGDATRTSIEHLGCFLIVQAEDMVTVLGPRSSAGSLHHALLTTIRSAH